MSLLSGSAYCGAAANPADVLSRWNVDPALFLALALALLAVRAAPNGRAGKLYLLGWGLFSFAVVSPLCALSVSLFSARIAQHMLILLAAAPALAAAWPGKGPPPLAAALAFAALLWFWHAPVPYEATFHGPYVYWLMHLTLFGSGVALWRALFDRGDAAALGAGALTILQMSALGAALTFATSPLYAAHLTTAFAWGLSPLDDQRLGGVIMWVPGCLAFLAPGLWRLARALREDGHALQA